MINNNMTDNEIIKALECCCNAIKCDEYCPLKHKSSIIDCNKEFLDLINRQKAEIERLEAENKKQKVIMEEMTDLMFPLPFETDYDKAIKTAKAEAIKEFAELSQNRCIEQQGCLYSSDIGAIYNELVGDENVD